MRQSRVAESASSVRVEFIGISDYHYFVFQARAQARAHEAGDGAREAAVELPARQLRIAESSSSARSLTDELDFDVSQLDISFWSCRKASVARSSSRR